MKYYDVNTDGGKHRTRKLTSELVHILAALMALSIPSKEYRQYFGSVRSWASVRRGIYFEGAMLPLAEKLNAEVGLGVSTRELEWEWARTPDEDRGSIPPGVAQRALRDPDAVCNTWTFIRSGESLRIPPCSNDCAGNYGACYSCCAAADLFADVLDKNSISLDETDASTLRCLEPEWI